MADKPYDIVTYHGKRLDRFSMQRLQAAEKRLGYDLTIIQGSYNSGVGASAGTHDRGGAVDLSAYDGQRKVRILREEGWAAWIRPTIPGLWNEHIHAILYDNKHLSSGAKVQRTEYYNGYDGLAGSGRDPHPRPSPIPHFKYRKPGKPKPTGPKINRARVNRTLRKPKYDGKTAMRQLAVVRDALRRKGFGVDGYDKYPAASTRRALRKFQRAQGWSGAGADGLLGRQTARRLGIRSRWAKLPEWGNDGKLIQPFTK